MAILLTGISGWITFGRKMDLKNDLIIFRNQIGESDRLMTTGRFVLVLGLVIFGGLKIGPMKPMIFKALKLSVTNVNNAIVSFGYCTIVGLIAATQSDVSKIVNLGGSSFGTLIVFIFPTIVGIKSNYAKRPFTRVLIWIYLIVMIVAMFYLTHLSLKPFYESSNNQKAI